MKPVEHPLQRRHKDGSTSLFLSPLYIEYIIGLSETESKGKTPIFEDQEEPIDLVNSTALAQSLFGYPIVPVSKMIDWVAHWVTKS